MEQKFSDFIAQNMIATTVAPGIMCAIGDLNFIVIYGLKLKQYSYSFSNL